MAYPEPIQQLIREFDKLPGIGTRTAERLAFHVLRAPPEDALNLALAIRDVRKHVKTCAVCCNVTAADTCAICSDARRDRTTVLVVEQPHDLEAFEASGYRGVYHVLGGAVNPVEGVEPAHLTIGRLVQRLERGDLREVILGMDPDFEGDGTALVVTRELRGALVKSGARLTRIARGVPAGSAIEFSNGAVLAEAVEGRRDVRDAGARDSRDSHGAHGAHGEGDGAS